MVTTTHIPSQKHILAIENTTTFSHAYIIPVVIIPEVIPVVIIPVVIIPEVIPMVIIPEVILKGSVGSVGV